MLGRLARARGPRWLRRRVIRAFIARYRVDLAESEPSCPEAYESFNAFFTRVLKAGAVSAAAVHNLFARNERHISYFETPRGPMAMVLVGAMIVAGIETVWAGQVAPARGDSGAGAARARR